MASSESVPSTRRHGSDHRNVSGVCGLLNPVNDQEENDGINSDRRYGSKHPDDRPNNLDLNYWRPCLSSDSHHHVKKRNQERELEKRGNTDRRLESGEDDRSQMQTDRDSSQRQAAGAVGGAIAANKKTDCNYLVTRLVKVRACLSQALKASEKCSKRVDAKGIQQFDKLSSVVKQLKEEEEFCLNMLQTLLAFRNSESQSLRSSGHRFEEPEDSDVENNKQEHDLEREREQDVNSSGSDNEQLDDAERTCNEVLSFMSQKHEIFYRLLQEQQPSSLSSQEDLNRMEGDLKSCTSWDEGMRRYRPTSQSSNPGLLTRPALSCRSLDGTQCLKEEEDLSGSTQLKQKYVRNLCETREEASADRINCTDRRDHLVVEPLGRQEQHRLEEKLRRLDEKKRNMNEMLQKLQSLRMERSFLNNELASVAAVEVRELGNERSGKFSSNQFPGGFVEEAARSKEGHPNHRKLETSNERSDGMQGIYETSEEFLFDGEERGSAQAASAAGVGADATFKPTIVGNDVGNDWLTMPNPLCNFYRRENDASSATSGNAGKSVNRKGELDAKSSPGRSEMKMVKKLEEQKAEDERCAQLQEKLRQLIGTKETLNNLKQLVVLVRQSPDLNSCTADNTLEFPKDLVTSCSLEEERGEDVVGKFQRQQAELAELMEEHQRLLELQVELERIQETQLKEPVDAGGPDPGARSPSEDATASQVLDETAEMHNSTKHMPLPMTSSATKMSSESTQVKFQDPIETVVSNEELYGRMRQQRMLREELLEKKKELQQMMQKEQSLKQNMRNQVTQSDTISYSNRSDQCRASPSEDITTATWGGSTAGNLESMGEMENRSCKEENDDDNKDDDDNDDVDDEGKPEERSGFPNNRMVQTQEEADEEEYSNDGDDDATGQEFEDADGRNDAIRIQVTKNSSLPNACFRRRFLPLKLSSDANYQREAVANGDDTERGDGTYCIDNDCDTSRIVRPIINSLSVPGVRHVSQNGSPNVQHRHKIASFACNAREHGLASRMLGNNRQVIRKNLFSQQRKHQNNVYINNDDNGGDELSALCNEMKLLKSMVSSLIRSLSGKRSLEEESQVQHNQLFLGLNKCFLQLLSSQNAMAERLNHLEQIVLNSSGARETITPMERFQDGGQGDSQSPGVKPLPKSLGLDPPCGWKGHFPMAGRKTSLSSESSRVEKETVGQPGFRSLQRNKRRSPGQRQPVPLHSYPSIVSSAKDGSDPEESVPIKTIHASDMGIPNFETCAVRDVHCINPPQTGTCFVRKWGDRMNCGSLGRMQPKQNNSSLPHTEKQYRKNSSKQRIWEPRGNNDGDLSTSDFSGQVRAPEFVHVKNSFSNDFVSTGGASSLTAIHRVAADGKTGRAGSAPAQRLPGPSYERSSFTFLQETIYSEVEALVAQNEHCPHYLIRLFQELQLLSTDLLRQRALLAIQDIVTKGAQVEQRNAMADEGVAVGCNASEEPGRSYVVGLDKTDLKAEFDYAEGVDSGSSLSTPHSTTATNNNSSLNDTVIQLNNALKWTRAEGDRMEEQDLVVASDEQFGQNLALELLHLVDDDEDDDDDDDDNESTVDGTCDAEINAEAERSSCVATCNQFPNIDLSQSSVPLHIRHDISSASEVELQELTGGKSDEDKLAEAGGLHNETRVADEAAEPGCCAKEKGGQADLTN